MHSARADWKTEGKTMRSWNRKVETSTATLRGKKGVAAVLFILSVAMASSAAERQKLSGHVPPAVPHSPSMGRLAGTNRLDLALELPLRNREALTNLLHEIYDPASINYHHYLTPEQFT